MAKIATEVVATKTPTTKATPVETATAKTSPMETTTTEAASAPAVASGPSCVS